jgi:tetratricopeptide (TPR) repeat protein
MKEDYDSYLDEESEVELVGRFEENLRLNKSIFFDLHEFEGIIDYYLAGDDRTKVRKAIEVAEKIYPNSAEIQLKKAEYCLLEERYEDALHLLEHVEKVESHNPELFYLKGEIFYEMSKFSKSLLSFDRAIAVATDDRFEMLYRVSSFYLENDEVNLAIKYLLKSYREDAGTLAVLFDLGYCYERNNELDKSISYYNDYLDLNPFSASVWYNLGIIYAKQGKFDESVECYDFCIAVDPSYVSAFHNKGNTLSALERYDEAIKVFTELLSLEPDNATVYSLLGECYERVNNLNTALSCYNKAISIEPDLAEGYFGIGIVMADRQKFDLSLDFIKRAIALDPEQYDFWIGLGKLYYELNRIDEAIKAYREAITINPDEADGYLALAEALLYQEKFSEVEVLVDELGGKFGSNATIKVINAAALYLSHRQKEALAMLGDAKRLDPSSIEDFFSLVSIVNDDDFIRRVNSL